MSASGSANRCEAEEFYRLLADPETSGTFFVRIAGAEVPIRIKRGRSNDLIFTFTGSVRRETHTLPRFSGFEAQKYVDATVVGFADPSLAISETIYCAWYAGHEGLETQVVLAGMIDRIIAILRPRRTVFLGGSAGGFAALFFSRSVAGSVAVVSNPQTDLERHPLHHQQMYRRECRPTLPSDVSLRTVIVSNLAAAYAESFLNTVIYLQNGADRLHIARHLTPFLAAFDQDGLERMLLKVGFWGGLAHATVPATEWGSWIRAVLRAPGITADEIQLTHFDMRKARATPEDPRRAIDLALAATLAERAARELRTEERDGGLGLSRA